MQVMQGNRPGRQDDRFRFFPMADNKQNNPGNNQKRDNTENYISAGFTDLSGGRNSSGDKQFLFFTHRQGSAFKRRNLKGFAQIDGFVIVAAVADVKRAGRDVAGAVRLEFGNYFPDIIAPPDVPAANFRRAQQTGSFSNLRDRFLRLAVPGAFEQYCGGNDLSQFYIGRSEFYFADHLDGFVLPDTIVIKSRRRFH